jgi:hypothetical protein
VLEQALPLQVVVLEAVEAVEGQVSEGLSDL